MEWTRIEHGEETISAADFLNGVLVFVEESIVFVPGYYVQVQLGDMDGPALRPRKDTTKAFAIRIVED